MSGKTGILRISLICFSIFSSFLASSGTTHPSVKATFSGAGLPPWSLSLDEIRSHPESGEGILLDTLRLVFNRMNVPFTIDRLPFLRAIKSLKKGDLDLTICLDNGRDYLKHYIRRPLAYVAKFGIWTHVDNPINDPREIKNETIYYATSDLRHFEFLKEHNKIVPIPVSVGIQTNSFLAGKVKYLIGGASDKTEIVGQHGEKLGLKFLQVETVANYLCWRKTLKDAKGLVQRFESEMGAVKKTDAYRTLASRYRDADLFPEL